MCISFIKSKVVRPFMKERADKQRPKGGGDLDLEGQPSGQAARPL